MRRQFQLRGAWQRFRDSRDNPPEPMWVMRWAVVLTLAAVAIEDSDTHPWGDWQTKVATVAMIAALIGALAVLS